MSKFLAFASYLLSPLLLLLAACGTDGTTYSNRIGANGHDVLYSKAQAKDGSARFECKASDSGWCHYTLFPEACSGRSDCQLAPLQQFKLARGQTRQLAVAVAFRPCVATHAQALRADCAPAAAPRQ